MPENLEDLALMPTIFWEHLRLVDTEKLSRPPIPLYHYFHTFDKYCYILFGKLFNTHDLSRHWQHLTRRQSKLINPDLEMNLVLG